MKLLIYFIFFRIFEQTKRNQACKGQQTFQHPGRGVKSENKYVFGWILHSKNQLADETLRSDSVSGPTLFY